jgi:HNH endonuclease
MSAVKKFRGYDFTIEDWLLLCAMYGNCCAICKQSKALAVDHIKPRVAGGTDDLWDIHPLCKSCNSTKGSLHDGKRVYTGLWSIKGNRVVCKITRTGRGLMNAIAKRIGGSDSEAIEHAVLEFAKSRGIEPMYWGEEKKEG